MTGTRRGVWVAAVVVVLAGAGTWGFGCAGDEETPVAQFAEECDANCAEGLTCLNRICTLNCSDANACRPYSDTAICTAGYCYEPCMTTFNCPNGLVCTMAGQTQGTCRVQ